jgi:hypothetical protein
VDWEIQEIIRENHGKIMGTYLEMGALNGKMDENGMMVW